MATVFEIGGSFWVPLLVGILISFCVEQLLRPRPALQYRRPQALAMHLGIWLVLFSIGLAIWQRPIFASGLNFAVLSLIVLVNNSKFTSLHEPFLLSDFRFFKALLRHPRLYLPFFGVVPAIGYVAVFVGFCFFALRSEPSMLSQIGFLGFLWCCAINFSAGAALLWFGMRNPVPVTLDPVKDLQTLGILGSFVRYWQEERANNPKAVVENLQNAFNVQPQARASQDLPHLIAIQCESFFDARRVFSGVHTNVLKNFDELTKLSSRAGRLNVPAWGANTVRTEFAFLSGIAPTALGVHRFNPYRKLARHGFPTIATELKKQGYRTVCVHPFSAEFYDRDMVFPALGFDEFIDIAAFSPDEKSGPFIGDLAIVKKIRTLLDAAVEPLLIFVITMENHGPLHQERVEEGDESRVYAFAPPQGYQELTIYLRHLQHTDAMLGEAYAAFCATARGGWLCAYGDHVPILPSIYKANGFVDGRTDYFVVGTGELGALGQQLDIAPEELALCLLRDAGCA